MDEERCSGEHEARASCLFFHRWRTEANYELSCQSLADERLQKQALDNDFDTLSIEQQAPRL
jgi:hypothetical protein